MKEFLQLFALFTNLTESFPLCMGFLKFFFFASLGELISYRISLKKWAFPRAFLAKAFLWGFIGVLVSFSFQFYSTGVKGLLLGGKLPFPELALSFAFFTSLTNNLTFAPLMMSFHKICHTYLDRLFEKKGGRISFENLMDSIAWKEFFKKVCLKKIPFFWIPIHTVTFLLPDVYRVLFASVLSCFLGIFLTLKN